MQTYLLVLTGRERASMCASASVRLVLFACLASLLLLLGPSSARPALDATGTQALKREKRSSWNCLELGLEVAGSIKEIPPTNGPLDLPTMPRASDGRRWSHVLQIYRGENGAGERGEMTAEREIEACVGYVVEDRSLACLVQERPTDVSDCVVCCAHSNSMLLFFMYGCIVFSIPVYRPIMCKYIHCTYV